MSPQTEARRHPRFTVLIQATIRAADGREIPANTKDMSRGGICLVCSHPLQQGEQVQLALSLLLGGASFSEQLVLPANVVWCTPVGQQYQLGARFGNLTHQLAGQMEMFLRFLEQEILVGEPSGAPGQDPLNPDFDTGDADKS